MQVSRSNSSVVVNWSRKRVLTNFIFASKTLSFFKMFILTAKERTVLGVHIFVVITIVRISEQLW